jgi:hypothetical protein
MTAMSGARILKIDAYGTAAFVITAFGGAIQAGFLRTLAAVVALVLFAVGCAVFVWALLLAFQRSRTDNIGMGGLFFLLAPTAPGAVRRPFTALLAVQTLVGLGTAIATFSVKPFTPLAFGVMVPVFGLGLAGLWAARYGQFGPRVVQGTRGSPANRTE